MKSGSSASFGKNVMFLKQIIITFQKGHECDK